MNQIARCDWLPERARWSHLARSGLPAVSRMKKFPRKPYNKSFIDQVCSVKMVGYWPHSFFASLWISTSSRSINTQKKNLANIQPSWPHTWSITHTFVLRKKHLYIRSYTRDCLTCIANKNSVIGLAEDSYKHYVQMLCRWIIIGWTKKQTN